MDEAVGWAKLLRVRGEVARTGRSRRAKIRCCGAADRYRTLRKFAPDLIEALEFQAARADDPMLAALKLLRDLNRSGKRDVPADAPMPFRKEWRRLMTEDGRTEPASLRDGGARDAARQAALGRRLGRAARPTTAGSTATCCRQPRSRPIAAELGLPATADEWLATAGAELDRRLKRFARRLQRGELEGVELRDGRLHVTPVKATTTPEADALADADRGHAAAASASPSCCTRSAARPGFAAAFTNLRTGERCDNENALLAAILADATNLGLARMAAASHGVTRDQLIWTADAYIRPETYKAALARIIDAHHALPIAAIWGDGTTSSSDGQFFRSAKRGDAAGEINARYGRDPGLSFYTHLSDQHGPYSMRGHVGDQPRGAIRARRPAAPWHAAARSARITPTPAAPRITSSSSAPCSASASARGCATCPIASSPASSRPPAYTDLQPLLGRRIKTDVIREHWDEIVRLVASLKAGTVAPSAMLRKLAAYRRQNQLDLALQELGRIERTLFMLDWLESPELRRRCHAGLNKSEQRHSLAQVICTFKQGRIADRGAEAQQFRASGLNLVIAAIVYWNSTYIADAVAHLRGRASRRPMMRSPTPRRSPGSTSASPATSCGTAPPQPPAKRRPLNLGRHGRRHDVDVPGTFNLSVV